VFSLRLNQQFQVSLLDIGYNRNEPLHYKMLRSKCQMVELLELLFVLTLTNTHKYATMCTTIWSQWNQSKI